MFLFVFCAFFAVKTGKRRERPQGLATKNAKNAKREQGNRCTNGPGF